MKRTLDILIASILILLLSPLMIATAIAIFISTPGPVFFVQERIGYRGRIFRMLKFRSMVVDSEKMGTGLFSFADDPRITRIGRILRRSSIDELPQLFNVLAGSMSLVGPRPPVTYELGSWEDYTAEMRKRFEVKPGLTGLAQISGRNCLNWDEKIALDNLYVDRFYKQGVLLDIVILFCTLRVVLSARNTFENRNSFFKLSGSISARARDSALVINRHKTNN
jgi:lipopolysaccharide/colanic/teichoic acid biosynthesis glycosyltransferase